MINSELKYSEFCRDEAVSELGKFGISIMISVPEGKGLSDDLAEKLNEISQDLMNELFIDVTTKHARDFAIAAHGNQKYGKHPYVYHLDAVAKLVEPYDICLGPIVAYLHDVVEDTKVTIEDIKNNFDGNVAEHVLVLTDEPGANRKERKVKTNAKLSFVPEDLGLVLIVKAADRLANLRESAKTNNDSKLQMYRNEHGEFRAAAYRKGLCDELWEEMDDILAGNPR